MDRFPIDDPGKNELILRNALEFIGAVRAGISWERFCMYAIRFSDAYISMLSGTDEARKFMSLTGIGREYIEKNVGAIFARLHFNRENDHYLTLALPRSASDAQIHKRWKELMLLYHPDKNSGEDAATCAKRINEAYSILKNPRKRMEYDRKTAKTIESYFTSQRSKGVQSRRFRRHLFISPRIRKMVPNLIIALSVALSCVVLLIIFFKNRTEVYTYHASVLPQETRHNAGDNLGMSDFGKKDTEERQGSNNAAFPHGGVPGQDNKKPASPPAERSLGERDTTVTNLKMLDPFGFRSKPADIATTTALPRYVIQEKTVVDTRADTVHKTPDEHREILGLNTQRQAMPSERDTKKDISLTSPQKNPSPEQREVSREMASVPPPMPASGEYRPDLETEIFLFLAQYIIAYEEGNISRFMDLFAKSAIENNKLQYADIRRFYGKNFEGNRYTYTLRNVRIRKSEEPVIVSGDYSISKLAEGDKGPKTEGTIRWTLSKEQGSLKIVRIEYERR